MSTPAKWTINGDSLDDLGIEDPEVTFANRDPARLHFVMPGAADGSPEYAAYADIELRKDGAVWFRGIVTRVEKEESIQRARHRYTISSPLWWLREIVYEQNWQIADDPDLSEPVLSGLPSSRLVLGQSDAGVAVTVGAQLTSILEFAKAAGVPIEIGVINIPLVIPWDEMRDRTCAEALDAVLRWIPDAVVYEEFGEADTTVRVTRRSALTATNLSPTDENVESLTIKPRPDLARPAVVLRYHRVHRLNQSAWEQIDTDFHPDPLPADWRLRALVSSIELAGSVTNEQWLEQPVETRAIPSGLVFGDDPADYVTSGPVLAFWKRHLPALDAPNVTEVTLQNGSHDFETSLPSELEAGAITDWMIDNLGVRTEKQTVRVEAMYKIDGEWVVEPGDEAPSFTVEIRATDASTRVYSSLEDSDYTPPEPAPVGLAEDLYNALSGPWSEVAGVIAERDCSGTYRPGQKLDIDDSPVQQVHEALTTGRTRLQAGPPEHLGHNDLVELLRARRDRRLTNAWQRRKTGQATA